MDKLVSRLDRIDPGSLQTHFLRLAQEKGLLETILHAIQEGIIVLDGDCRIKYANRAAESLLGFSAENVVGEPMSRYIHDFEWERLMDWDEGEWSKLISREIEITYPEHRVMTFYVVPLSAVSEEESGAVVILRDITRDLKVEAHTLESERLNAVTLLAAGVAHEIGNPLNALTIHLQLLERESENLPTEHREAVRELVDISRKEVARLDQIINQFLRAVRPVRPNFERASLKDILDATLDFLKHEIQNRDVLVEVVCPEEIPATQVDQGQIRQAFYNVIRNAIQAMPGGGILKITLSSDDRFVTVSFRDTGEGISPDHLSDIFQPYHTTKSEGSGLGLMIVQRIIRDHGGEIEVDTEPGVGTTFKLYLPRDERRIRLLKAHKEPAVPNEVHTSAP